MRNWMHYLGSHYEAMREQYPNDKLLILFDVDGTILDMRYTMLYLLKAYDQQFGTSYFDNLHISHITFSDADIANGLRPFCIPVDEIEKISRWYNENRWSLWAIFEANRPFPGVMEVIRWFQLQDNTFIGLNSGRSEVIREDTIQSLNRLGQEYRVVFDDRLLKMKRKAGDKATCKVQAIKEFRDMGYRVIAMIDNEPGILDRIAESDVANEILLLHASTVFRHREVDDNTGAYHGNVYDLTELIPQRALPKHIQFVWNNINNDSTLMRFIDSNVKWADITGTTYNLLNKPIARIREEKETQSFYKYAAAFVENSKSMRITIQPQVEQAELLIDILADAGIDSSRLWLNGKIDALRKETFVLLSDIFPKAVIECPVDFLIPIILTTEDKAEHILDTYANWGINRFSLSWKSPNVKKALTILDKLGFDVTIYDVVNLDEFLHAVLYLPTAIVSDFNFPMWESSKEKGKIKKSVTA